MTAIQINQFVHASFQAGTAGRVVLKPGDDGEIALAAERRSFKGMVLEFLSNVPLFKNLHAVRSYIKDQHTSNAEVVALLASALAEAYDSMPAGVAIEIFGKGKPINESSLRQIMKNAALYYGVGAATKNEARVTINLWPYQDMNHGGHASISIDDGEGGGEHVSWWPNNEYDKADNPQGIAKFARAVDKLIDLRLGSNFTDKFGGSLDSYASDMAHEMGTAGTKLDAGEKARRAMALGQADAAALKDASYFPRATQVRDAETGEWGVVAQKINFPMAGKTSVDGVDKVVRFGLDKDAILKDARYVRENAQAYQELADLTAKFGDADRAANHARLGVEVAQLKAELATTVVPRGKETEENLLLARSNLARGQNPALLAQVNSKLEHIRLSADLASLNEELEECEPVTSEQLAKASARARAAGPEIGYRFASDSNNCASMAIRVLVAGGAQDYVPLPKMTTLGMNMIKPDEQFANYAFAVQTEMDRLNGLSDQVEELTARGDTQEIGAALQTLFGGRQLNRHEQGLREILLAAVTDRETSFRDYA